jgi:hypothetical protein
MKLVSLILISLLSFPVLAQVDSTELRKPPVLSDLAIIYDRNLLTDEMNSMEKPVFEALPVQVSVEEISTRFNGHPAIKLSIPEVTLDDLQKSWTKYLRKAGDGKLQKEGNTLVIQDVVFEDASSEMFDVEMQFKQEEDKAVTWLAMEADSTMITPETHAKLFSSMEAFMLEKGKEAYRDKVNADLDQDRKDQDSMQKELNGLVKDSEKLHKKITDNNIAINQMNNEIDQNEIEIKLATEDAMKKKAAISAAYDKDSEKEAKKNHKDAEKDKKKLRKDREKMFQNIVDYKREIAEAEQAIGKNLEDQKNLLLKIHAQTLRIEAMKDKVAKIK